MIREEAAGLLAVVVLALAVWAVSVVGRWRADAQELVAVRADLATAEGRLRDYEKRVQEYQHAQDSYESELATLHARNQALVDAGRAVVPVRLCSYTAPAVPGGPDFARGAADAAARTGVVPGTAGTGAVPGPDIGPDLRALADDADDIVARARLCQSIVTLRHADGH